MASETPTERAAHPGPEYFATTHWSVVLTAQRQHAGAGGALPPLTGIVLASVILGVIVSGVTAWSLMLKDRSLQDRIAGTWLVPR